MKKGSVTKISIIIVWILVFLCLILSSGTGSGWKRAVALFILPVILVIALLLSPNREKTNNNKKVKLSPSVKIKRYGIANLALGIIMLASFLFLWTHQGPDSAAGFIFVIFYFPCEIVTIIICIILLILAGRMRCEYSKIKKKYLAISIIGLILALLPIMIFAIDIA